MNVVVFLFPYTIICWSWVHVPVMSNQIPSWKFVQTVPPNSVLHAGYRVRVWHCSPNIQNTGYCVELSMGIVVKQIHHNIYHELAMGIIIYYYSNRTVFGVSKRHVWTQGLSDRLLVKGKSRLYPFYHII